MRWSGRRDGHSSGKHDLEAGTKPDIAVRVRALVVEVQRSEASIAGIVAIATAKRKSINNALPF